MIGDQAAEEREMSNTKPKPQIERLNSKALAAVRRKPEQTKLDTRDKWERAADLHASADHDRMFPKVF